MLDFSIKPSDAERIIHQPAEVQRRAVERKLMAEFRTVAAAADKVEQEISEKAGVEAASALLALPLSETVTLLNSTVSNLHRLVEAESVDLTFSYPPVGEHYLALSCALASFAVHALRPEGLMALLVDSTLLPEITERVGRHDSSTSQSTTTASQAGDQSSAIPTVALSIGSHYSSTESRGRRFLRSPIS